MTPYECELLIAIHTRDINDVAVNTDLRKETLESWVNQRLIEVNPFSKSEGRNWRLTPYGEAWLSSILSNPYPTIKYFDKNDTEIK